MWSHVDSVYIGDAVAIESEIWNNVMVACCW